MNAARTHRSRSCVRAEGLMELPKRGWSTWTNPSRAPPPRQRSTTVLVRRAHTSLWSFAGSPPATLPVCMQVAVAAAGLRSGTKPISVTTDEYRSFSWWNALIAVKDAFRFTFASLCFDRAWNLMKFGIAIAARMPMIATTIISSMSVKPCSASSCEFPLWTFVDAASFTHGNLSTMGQDQERRLQQARQDGQDQGAPDHDDGQRLLRLGPEAAGERRRQQANHRDRCRHEHGPEPPFRAEPCTLDEPVSFPPQALRVRHDEQRVLHRHAEDGDESHGRGDRQVRTGEEQREHAPGARHGDSQEHDCHVAPAAHRGVDEERDEQERDGYDEPQPSRRRVQLVDLARPLQVGVVWQLNRGGDALLRLLDARGEVAAAHGELHGRVSEGVLPVHHRRAFDRVYPGKLSERDLRPVRRGDEDLPDGPEILPIGLRPAHDQIEVLLPLVDLRDGRPTHRGLYDRLDVSHVEPISGAQTPIRHDADVRLTQRMEEPQVLDPAHAGEHGDDLARLLLVHPEVRADDLDRVLPLHSGERLRQLARQLLGEVLLGHATPPLRLRLQGREQLDVVEA